MIWSQTMGGDAYEEGYSVIRLMMMDISFAVIRQASAMVIEMFI